MSSSSPPSMKPPPVPYSPAHHGTPPVSTLPVSSNNSTSSKGSRLKIFKGLGKSKVCIIIHDVWYQMCCLLSLSPLFPSLSPSFSPPLRPSLPSSCISKSEKRKPLAGSDIGRPTGMGKLQQLPPLSLPSTLPLLFPFFLQLHTITHTHTHTHTIYIYIQLGLPVIMLYRLLHEATPPLLITVSIPVRITPVTWEHQRQGQLIIDIPSLERWVTENNVTDWDKNLTITLFFRIWTKNSQTQRSEAGTTSLECDVEQYDCNLIVMCVL